MEEIGKRLSLKIEWPEEVAPAGMFAGFQSGRYDAVCAGYTRNPARSTHAAFSVPVFYFSYSIFVRGNDTRFDADQKVLNDPHYSFSVIDGELANYVIKDEFPKAKVNSLPDGAISDSTIRMVNVATGKSDATIIETAIGDDYIRANPGTIKALVPPISVLPSNIIIPHNEVAFKDMLDAAIANLHETHFIEKTIHRHTTGAGYYAPSPPYAAQDLAGSP
jgi:ABC-type amino acid transport substrate-binding protein